MDSNFDESERVFYERKPIVGNGAHVVLFTLLFLALMLTGLWGLFSALETGDSRWGAIPISCGLSLYILWWRVHEHDARAFYEREGVKEPPPKQTTPVATYRPYTREPGGTGNQITMGKYTFTAEQWKAVGYWLQASGWKMVRDQLRKAKAWDYEEINLRWKGIVEEFQRLGWADEKQMITPAGRVWFNNWLDNPPPTDPPTPRRLNGSLASHTASGGGGGEERRG